ncbi:MAG: metal-dependent hydrolase [Burkholderiaceae bacterium]
MSTLVVRRLLVDMEQPIARYWCDGDAFRSAFLNALSMSFPFGEQFFIDSVREGFKALPADQQMRFESDVKGFVGQEATHRRLHGLYNEHLERLGYVNGWEPRARERSTILENQDVRHWLAVTAAYEHFTAVLAEWFLAHPETFGMRDERLRTLWLWHSAEETEHRAVAFDLYRALGGNDAWRIKWFRQVTLLFLVNATRQTIDNLRADGDLWRWSTLRSAASTLFGRRGLIKGSLRRWRAYFRPGFHPHQADDTASREWLARNGDRFTPVGG